MLYFAEIDKNNKVTRVIVVNDKYASDGENWCNSFLGGTWKRTSYETRGGVHSQGKTPLRKNYAGIGYEYDVGRDAFIPPKPFESWEIKEASGLWEAPIKYPQDGNSYNWNENSKQWNVEYGEL